MAEPQVTPLAPPNGKPYTYSNGLLREGGVNGQALAAAEAGSVLHRVRAPVQTEAEGREVLLERLPATGLSMAAGRKGGMMTRSIGGMYRRGSIWWVRFTVDGKKVRESTGSSRKADARKLLARRIAEISDGRYQPDGDKLTFGDLERMLKDHYRGKRSRDRAERAVKHLKRHLGLYRARAITADRLTSYRNARLDEGAAPATAKYELAVLGKGLTLAVRSGKLAKRPPMPEITVENTRRGFFEAAEFEAVKAELPEQLKGLVEAAYLMGWRIQSELMPMQWRQVDLKAGIVRLEPGTTKNGRGRTFPIGALPQLTAVFERQRVYADAVQRRTGGIVSHVFHRDGRPIKTFREAWNRACERAGLVGKIPHDFRRTAVRNMERAGVSRSVAMQLVGHETESIYRRYAITTERDLEEGVVKLAGLQDSTSRKIHPILGTIRAQSAGGGL